MSKPIKSPLHILHLEDDPNDAALVENTLKAGGVACTVNCVSTRDAFVAGLERGGYDLILSDYSLPAFDGLSAVEIVNTRWPELPVIIVSGSLGEERAIDALKGGATDYVLKERLTRLVPAVRRAMKEVEVRSAHHVLEQETILQAMALKAAANAIVITNPRGIILWVNPAFTALTGYSEPEVIGRTPRLVKSGVHDPAFYEALWRTILAGETWRGEFTNRRKDGSTYVGESIITPVRAGGGKITHFIGIMNDVTDRKRLEEQFIEAQKMEVIGRLAGGVAHDFNNILGVIMGYSDLLTHDLDPESPLREYVEQIRHASDRAVGLTRQLLIFSRKQTVQPVVLDLDEVVLDLDKMLRRLVGEHITITLEANPASGRIKADPGYVGQVLMNLVVNARDAMPNGGKLTIATRNVTLDAATARAGVVPGDYVLLTVSDTGTGMTDEVKAHLFEAFFTTKAKGKGTGLGLSTCQTIVQQSGGHIDIESDLGGGTTFKLYFPRVDEPLDGDTKFFKAGPVPRGTEALLVVEDEAPVRQLVCNALVALGYEVLPAANGQEALRVVREHKSSPIRLVITDVIMPQMGGKVMAEWLKTAYPDLKILFTSGYTDDALASHGVLDAGVEFLAKPYATATLARKVREMLDAGGKTQK